MNSKKIAFYCQYDKRVKNDYFLDNYDDTNEYVRLRNELVELGYEVHTLDIYQNQKIVPDICIFLDIPTTSIDNIINTKRTKSIAMLREAELINQINYDKNRHKEFDIILTWKQNLVDNKKYFFYPSTRFVKSHMINHIDYKNRKLCTLINSNLTSTLKGELYSHRLKVIEWFEKNYLEDFDLWGYGWDEYRFKIRGRTIFKSKLLAKKRKSYKGIAQDKLKTLSKYKFSICFENTNIVDDYISEKIFDAFLTKCVPIYWGAPNIDKIIPKECFIDFRDFKNYDELYMYIKNISDKEYMSYIKAIENFLKSDKSYKFTLNNWIDTIKDVILNLGESSD